MNGRLSYRLRPVTNPALTTQEELGIESYPQKLASAFHRS
ncbi:hypothetical protein VARIO8X_70060 [Burkholderiales bacterium 8X]|nr:hypothetical protein VARIO8X_70060 [Burkholderiales bacterium 8X]